MTSTVWSIWPDIETGMIGAAAPSPRSAGLRAIGAAPTTRTKPIAIAALIG